MKTKPNFCLRKICGENVIVGTGTENIDFTSIIRMNESAAVMWNAVVDLPEFTLDDLVKALTDEYEVGEDTARADAATTFKQWVDAGIAED